ncbi:hypothetical protein PHYBLDRAFT_171341 [Phycomyces blakesleeanus NRRL 1555(-)]|uniref:Retrograde transport protein Dsl1 C-terminal domain-containing protein n=1 Tax=Phycomyces blakesleeanus (strain ATCC 8743b / DSM 1359 / FGSC 10004 / NBRC 33097 / NRRL 1555) TaxID=763407 RepID=A0A162WRV1_PHYB8|nr:hypothetical protein PHYBLDRAFT_171341 [Phycomyces blakesleeanus NRRL 1555(-)]OAD70595.1 hypothetical protein PHYBLDRAFT_171341 [Phycomyces blakesleeanus NRRL 1555(-)]|eukprot:XP_018288635.1 hypothetical protein PHYBLDRAFT_171341 [Phycomyces blakesleeanus NRRL 1555(-)]
MSTLIPFGDAFVTQLFTQDSSNPLLDTPVDSSSLSAVLDSLYKTTDALHEQLFNNICDNVDIFSASYEQMNELTQRVTSLVGQAMTEQSNVIDPTMGTHAVVSHALRRYTAALETSQQHQTQLDSLRVLVTLVEALEDIESILDQQQIVPATEALLRLQANLTANEPYLAHTVHWVRERIEQQKNRLVCILQDFLAAAITFETNRVKIITTGCSDPSPSLLLSLSSSSNDTSGVDLKDVFGCLDQLQLLTTHMSTIKRSMFKHIIKPYLEFDVTADVVVTKDGSKGATLTLRPTTDKQINPLRKLKNLGQILDFCFENLCGADLDHARLFGNLALPELFGLVIEKVLGPAIPTTSKDLGTFGAVSRAAESLEQTSRDHFGWSEKENSLKEYVSHLDRHFARKRGEKVLLEGRNVMLRRLYDVEDAEEEEEKKEKEGEGMGKAGTETQHYRITQTPQLLVLLLTDMIQEASGLVNTHPISAAHLVHATADLLDLYRAIMPSYHRAHLIARPANCLVFRNDCFWIARQLQHKLGASAASAAAAACSAANISATTQPTNTTSSLFPDLAKRLCDEAEQLRLLGNWWAQLAFEQQMHRINLLLERLDGFVTIADHRQRQQCDEAIGGIIGQVRNFSDEARPVLDRRLFVETMARLVDRLLIRLIRMIEDIVDIGAEESELISRSLNSVAQLVSTFDLPGHDATEPEVMARVGSWQKFWLLKDMLEMTMKDIMEAWRRGSLGMFTVEEMCSLVCALFADTDRREAVLDEIKSGRVESVVQEVHSVTPPITVESRRWKDEPVNSNDTPTDLADTDEQDGWGWDEADENIFVETGEENVSEPMPDLEINTEEGWGDADEDLFVADEMHK